MQANHIPTSHQDSALNDENKLDSLTCCLNSLPSLKEPVTTLPMLIHICHMHLTLHNPPLALYCPLQDTCMSNHTHLGTSSGVQLVLVNGQLHHFSMTSLSCVMQHGEPTVG